MSLIGKKAPLFHVQALKNGSITALNNNDLLGRYTVLFFYPLDFTFVCPTEIHALQAKVDAFKKRGADVYAISVDSIHTHRAWANTPRSKGGIEGVSFTLLSDIHKSMTQSFDVLDEDEGVSLRATFILDQDNVVQHASVNNLSFGRNIDEIIRTLDAIIFVEDNGENVCPANWLPGQTTMKPTPEGVETFFEQEQEK